MSNPFSTSPIESGGGGGGGGDVVGPGSSTAGNLAEFDDTTGALLADSGIASNTVVIGPASATDNAIARYNTTTGKLLQDSGVTVGDVAAGSVAVATTTGNSLTVAATAPAAANGATVAGKTIGITASNAVASLDTAGAAAGGSVTITGGAAARNASGNANGGDINLVGGAGIGTGTVGQVIIPVGAAAAPGIAFAGDLNTGFYDRNSDRITVALAGLAEHEFQTTGFATNDSNLIGWTGGAVDAVGIDTALHRAAAGVVAFGTSVGTKNNYFQWGGQAFLAADGTNATTTMATTGLSVNVTTGRKYKFKLVLYVANSLAADGVKVDFDNGSATMTNFIAHGFIYDSVLVTSARTAALATDIVAATITGNSIVIVEGSFEPSSTGTFSPRYAMNAAVSGTLTLARGSTLEVFDNP